jgi:hypothetical protein
VIAGLTISSLLVAGLFVGLITQRRSVAAHEQLVRLRHHLRAVLGNLVRDVAKAGYGISVSDYWLPHWIDWEPALTSNPVVLSSGADGNDVLLMAGAFDGPAMELASDAPRGATTLEVVGDATGIFDPYVKKVIFLGGAETVRAVGVSGSLLRISTHPTEIRGLRFSYTAGAHLEPVVVRRYERMQDARGAQRRAFLACTDSGAAYRDDWGKLAAKDIEQVRFSIDGDSVGIELTARAPEPDPHYTDPDHRDHYRRLRMGGRAVPQAESAG